MAKFSDIKTKGKVIVTEEVQNDETIYKFEFSKFDPDTGDPLAQEYVTYFQEQDLIFERSHLVNQRDTEVAKFNDEIAEIDAKLAAIDEVKT